ncbi:hypothetical protein MMPV_006931 [Pyropia vietnamensis]
MGSGGLTASVVNGSGGGGGMADVGLPMVATPGSGGVAAPEGSRRRSRSLLSGWSDRVRSSDGKGGGGGEDLGGGGGGGIASGGITWSSSGGGKRNGMEQHWRRPMPRGGVWALTFGLALITTLLLFGRRSGSGSGGGGGAVDPLAALSPAQRAAAVNAASRALAAVIAADGGGGRDRAGGMGAAEAAALGAVDDAAGAAVGVDPVAALERWTDDAYARSRLRVYIYDLPGSYNAALVRESHERPPPIRDPLCDASFYSAEVSVHRFLLQSAVRTTDPEEADFFYVPIYTTCFLMTHLPNDLETTGRHFATGMHHVINELPYYNRSGGRDHVYTFTQGFGARHSGNWRRFRNGLFLVHNGEWTADEFTPHKDIVIPPDLTHYLLPRYMEPARGGGLEEGDTNGGFDDADAEAPPDGSVAVSREGEDASEGGDNAPIEAAAAAVSRARRRLARRRAPKKWLLQFGGQVVAANVSDSRGSNYSGGVRQYVQEHLIDKPGYRITGTRSGTYLADLASSTFCLCPEGWHPWSPRPVYAVLTGCIPVVVSDRQQLPLDDIVDWDAFTVWMRPSDIAGIDAVLTGFSDDEVADRQAAMRRVWRALWYGPEGLAPQGMLAELAARKSRVKHRRVYSTPAEQRGGGHAPREGR